MKHDGSSPADKIMSHGFALGKSLGIPERELAGSALAIAVSVAERNGDADGYLAILLTLMKKEKR